MNMKLIDRGIDNYDVEIYDFSSNTSFTDTKELRILSWLWKNG